MERIEERIWREAAVVRWIVFTVVGGTVNLFLLLIIAAYYRPVRVLWSTIYPDWQSLIILTVATLLFLICYSILASHLLPEKRFVSPIDMSILGAMLNLILYFNTALLETLGISILGSFALFLFGVFAELIAKPLVGVGMGETDRKTFQVMNCPINALASVVGKLDLRDSLALDKKRSRHDGKLIIYRNSESSYRFFVILAEHPESKSVLIHCEAYSVGKYVAGSSSVGKRMFERDASYLEKVVVDEGKIQLQPADYDNSFPFYSEIERILLEPTKSRFATVARLPKRTVAIFAGIVFLAFAYYFSYVGKQLTSESFITAILGIVALVLGLLPFIKGPAQTKEWTEE